MLIMFLSRMHHLYQAKSLIITENKIIIRSTFCISEMLKSFWRCQSFGLILKILSVQIIKYAAEILIFVRLNEILSVKSFGLTLFDITGVLEVQCYNRIAVNYINTKCLFLIASFKIKAILDSANINFKSITEGDTS